MDSPNSPVTNDPLPAKPGVKAGFNLEDGTISQIPGLSPTIGSCSEGRTWGRRAGILDTDSAYVKLAKQGGHKGLLWHDETVTSQKNVYKPPDWFCPPPGDHTPKKQPSLSTPIEGKKGAVPFQPLDPPFWGDRMSMWERDDRSLKDKMSAAHCREGDKLPPQESDFRKLVFDKKTPVDMSKLLSFGYIHDDEDKR